MSSKSYRLLKPLKIAGRNMPVGADVMLDERQSTWLAQQGAIEKMGVSARTVPSAAPQGMPARRSSGCGCGR